MESIAIIVPTRNRYSIIRRCILNLLEVDYPEKEIMVICDDDLSTFNRLTLNLPGFYKMYTVERSELVKATIFGINNIESEFFVYYNDDMIMHKDCLTVAMKEFKERFKDGIGLIGFDDGINRWIGTVGLTTKKTVEKFDCWTPAYVHYYADTEIGVRTLKAGCFYWSHDAKVEHLHPLVNKAKWDNTYRESQPFLMRDGIAFTARNGVYVHKSREELEHENCPTL